MHASLRLTQQAVWGDAPPRLISELIDAGANTVVDGVNLAEPPCVVHLPCMSVCSAHPLSVVCVYACVVLRSGRTTRWLRRCSMLRRWSLRLRIAPPHRAPQTERHHATAGRHAKAGIPVCVLGRVEMVHLPRSRPGPFEAWLRRQLLRSPSNGWWRVEG